MKDESGNKNAMVRAKLLRHRGLMIEYLEMKTEVEDFHAVADAAMDLREIDTRLKVLDES